MYQSNNQPGGAPGWQPNGMNQGQQGRAQMASYTGPDARPAGSRRDGMRPRGGGLNQLRHMMHNRSVPNHMAMPNGMAMQNANPNASFLRAQPQGNSLDQRAIEADPQGFAQWRQDAARAGYNYGENGAPTLTSGQEALRNAMQLRSGQNQPYPAPMPPVGTTPPYQSGMDFGWGQQQPVQRPVQPYQSGMDFAFGQQPPAPMPASNIDRLLPTYGQQPQGVMPERMVRPVSSARGW